VPEATIAQKCRGDDGSVVGEWEKKEDGEVILEEIQEIPQSPRRMDGIGVPYYRDEDPRFSASEVRRKSFIHHFFVPKAVPTGESGYVLKMQANKAVYMEELSEEEQLVYPPYTFDRRVTMNNWRTLLTEAMLLAGLRLAALQANLQAIMALVSNPVYEDVPFAYKLAWLVALSVAFVMWVLLGLSKAIKYGGFCHPDTKTKRSLCLMSSTLLVMFAVPNDVILLPIQALPIQQGGLLCEASCIEDNWRWPVLTIAHSSQQDHDYTNSAGVSIQLPLFLIVDLGCTALNLFIATNFGILNYTALIQMCLCSIYALRQIYVAAIRWHLKRHLLIIWRKTAADHNMAYGRQCAAKNKYIAEGGDPAALERDLARAEAEERRRAKEERRAADQENQLAKQELAKQELAKQDSKPGLRETAASSRSNVNSRSNLSSRSKSVFSTSASLFMETEDTENFTSDMLSTNDSSGVPWFCTSDVKKAQYRKFAHHYFVGKVRSTSGSYGPKMDEEGIVQYVFKQPADHKDEFDNAQFKQPAGHKEYPPPTFDRRVTLNNWQEMIMMCMLEAGLRNAGLQANVMMAILMLENPLYSDMPIELWLLFVSFLAVGLLSWVALGFKRAMMHWDFVHPDTRLRRVLAVCTSAILMMFAMPNDVVLFPLHLLPLEKGGLLAESGLVDGCAMWPVHTIAHYSKQDHDFINTNDSSTQVPLFIFIDLGCTITNLIIAIRIGVFNFTALMQMCTCGAYAFVKLREIILRCLLRKELLHLWQRTATDPCMSEPRREAAKAKYRLIGGSMTALAKLEAALEAEAPLEREWSKSCGERSETLAADPH